MLVAHHQRQGVEIVFSFVTVAWLFFDFVIFSIANRLNRTCFMQRDLPKLITKEENKNMFLLAPFIGGESAKSKKERKKKMK